MAKKAKTESLEKDVVTESIIKDLEQLYDTVMEVINEKDEIIAKQEELLVVRKHIMDSYINLSETQESFYKKQINRLYLAILCLVAAEVISLFQIILNI